MLGSREEVVDLFGALTRVPAAQTQLAVTLDVAVRDGRIKTGDLLLFEAFGAGFTWGSALVRY